MYLKFKSCNKQITQFLNYYKIEIQNSTIMFLEKKTVNKGQLCCKQNTVT